MGQQSGKHFCFHPPFPPILRIKPVVPNLESSFPLGDLAGEGEGRHCVLVGKPRWEDWGWEGGQVAGSKVCLWVLQWLSSTLWSGGRAPSSS